MKNILAVLLILFVFTTKSSATHLMGGEVTWECIKSGPNEGFYVFHVRIYRDCQGVALSSLTNKELIVHNHPILSSIPLNYMGSTDISPSCNILNGPNLPFSCGGANIGNAGNGNGAVEEHVFESNPIKITGVPDINGWHFTYTDIARNLAIINLANNTGQYGFTLRAVMYSYIDSTGTVLPNNNNCYDSSPKFYEIPRTILEVGNGFDPLAFSNGFTYSHNAFDEEQDSLDYSWGQPLDGYNLPPTYNSPPYDYLNADATNAIPFTSGYSVNTPIQGIFMNSQTGRTYYPADYVGNYVTCTNVSAYKCGQKVSEIYREIQVVLVPPICNLGDTTNGNIGADTLCNVRPYVQPPFFYPATPSAFQWDTLAHCGDTISFDFNAIDNDFYPNGSQQDLLFEVSGGQFYDYSNNIPCQNPPCATFNEINTGSTPPFITSGGSGSGEFEWITSCNHVLTNCEGGPKPSVYTFVIKVSDDFCPTPAIEMTSQVISITVYPSCDSLKTNTTTTPAGCLLSNGTAQVSPSGGIPPFITYWSDTNGIPVNPNALASGDYIVRIIDSTYCESIDTFTVLEPSSLPLTTLSATDISCYGDNDGSIISVQTGGQAPYTYLWSNGFTTQSISNLSSGTYNFTLTDSNNCENTSSIVITEPTQILTSITNNNGILIGNADGGIAPYTYQFIDPTSLVLQISTNNFGNNDTIIPTISGVYTFLVLDENGCSDSVSTYFYTNFTPTVLVSLSNNYCDSLADLTIEISQDSGEVDMSTGLFQSTAGAFDIISMNVGDTIGTAILMAGGGTIMINTYLMVSSVININQAIICANDSILGCVGSFTINNNTGSGIYILTNTIPDGNNYTLGNMSSATFTNCFINPCGFFTFNSTINSELGDVDYQSNSFGTTFTNDISICNVIIHPNPSDGRIRIEMNEVNNEKYKFTITDILGKTVYDVQKIINGSYEENINISKFGKGTYLFSISSYSTNITKKLIVK